MGPGKALFSVTLKPSCNVKVLSKLLVRGTGTKELYIYTEMQIRRGGHVLREVKSQPVEEEKKKKSPTIEDHTSPCHLLMLIFIALLKILIIN